MEKIFISLEKEVFKGNILDVTYNNGSVIYNANKYFDNMVDVDYFEENPNTEENKTMYYDSCILFFSLNKLRGLRQKELLFKKIFHLLKPNGYLYIWDVEKKPFTTLNKIIEVALPGSTVERFQINCFNLISSNTSEEIKNILKDYFQIKEEINSKQAFKLVCKRRDV